MPKVIQTNKNSLYIIYGIISISILSLLFINNIYADESSNLNYSVTVEPALNITTSSNKVSLDLNPLNHDFDSQDLTVSVSTNNETGYKLYVNATGNKLIEKDDNSLYIDTLSSEVPENNFTANRWGYKLNSDNYLPFVLGTLINSSKTAIENNSSTLTFAAKVGYETKAGTYALALNFQATANPHIYYMQDLDASLCTTDPVSVVDSRDERTYYIARLKDDKCWMIQNLRLGQDAAISDIIALGDKSSSVNDNFDLKGKTSDGKMAYSTVNGTPYQNNSSQYYCNEYGCYYNWYTATAGSGTTYTTSGDVAYSICPAGWTLPSRSDWVTLTTAYGGTGNVGRTALLVANSATATENVGGEYMPGLVLGGSRIDSGTGAFGIGTHAYYWSRTVQSAQSAYRMGILSANSNPSVDHVYSEKFYGFMVRCLLK